MICIGLLLLLGVVFQYAWRTKIPRRLLIGPIRAGTQELVFEPPRGDHYHIVVGVPRDATGAPQRVYGNLLIRTGSNQVVHIPFDTGNSTLGNWLAAEHLDALIVTLPRNGPAPNLDKQWSSHGRVFIKVEASGADFAGASLWLCYLERWFHYKMFQ
jgi:hypothetical protein